MKKSKLFVHLSVILIVSILIVLIVILSLKSCQSNFKYYTAISKYEWMELECYSAKPQKYLGKYPDDIFCNTYSLKGIDKNELLYLKGSDIVGFGSNEYTKIIMNDEFEEPNKRFSIKEIVITEPNNTTIKIKDITIINQIEQILKTQNGDTYYFLFDKFNASINFDVSCDLSWSCIFEKRADNSIHLIGYNQKELEFKDYNVTDIFNDNVTKLPQN